MTQTATRRRCDQCLDRDTERMVHQHLGEKYCFQIDERQCRTKGDAQKRRNSAGNTVMTDIRRIPTDHRRAMADDRPCCIRLPEHGPKLSLGVPCAGGVRPSGPQSGIAEQTFQAGIAGCVSRRVRNGWQGKTGTGGCAPRTRRGRQNRTPIFALTELLPPMRSPSMARFSAPRLMSAPTKPLFS